MSVIALIINKNGAAYISETLSHLAGVPDLPIMVLDNASDDDSIKIITDRFPAVSLITTPHSLSDTEALNFGLSNAAAAKTEYIWILGSDVLVDDNSLKELVEIGTKYRDVGMISSKIFVHPDKDHVIYYAGGIMDWFSLFPVNRGQDQIDVGQFENDIETDLASPISTLLKTRVLTDVGLLDPAYYTDYGWLDFCYRQRKIAWRIMYACQSRVWYRALKHTDVPGYIKNYFQIRNQLLFGLRFGPFYTKFNLVKNGFHQYFFGHPWERRAILDFFTGNFGRGSYDG